MSKDFPVSWDELHRNGKALAWRLLDLAKTNGIEAEGGWKGIIGITRGGLVPACIVARELDIKLIETFCISSYDHQNQRTAKIIKAPENIGDGRGWLVIDDLVDTGSTFKIAREKFPAAHYGCIYAKPEGISTTDSFITEVSQDTWIHFPWDLEAQYSQPLAERPQESKKA
jgi:xanthine phosphoribosyltransferase